MAMKSSLLSISSSEDVLVLSLVSGQGRLRIHGYSGKHAEGGTTATLVASLKEDGDDVVALAVSSTNMESPQVYLLVVTRNGSGRPWIAFDKPFAPPKDRLYRVHDARGYLAESGFDVQVEGEWFTTLSNGAELGMRVVNGDVLCRYLASKATADEVRAVAGEIEEGKASEEDTERIKMLLSLCEGELNKEREERHKEIKEMSKMLDKFSKKIDDTRGRVVEMAEEVSHISLLPFTTITKKRMLRALQELKDILDNVC
jgi:hypothetical protein